VSTPASNKCPLVLSLNTVRQLLFTTHWVAATLFGLLDIRHNTVTSVNIKLASMVVRRKINCKSGRGQNFFGGLFWESSKGSETGVLEAKPPSH